MPLFGTHHLVESSIRVLVLVVALVVVVVVTFVVVVVGEMNPIIGL